MNKLELIDWLLEGDVSIQYQVWRDLLGEVRKDLQKRIAKEGWGKELLSRRNKNGHWGQSYYQPKWISTHYTLLDLRNLNLDPNNTIAKDAIEATLDSLIAEDGGIQLGPSTSHHSDVCVNAMFLNFASYFKTEEQRLHSVVDSILDQIMEDGGYNCRTNTSGAKHSSLHTTLSVLEGLIEFQKANYQYKSRQIKNAIKSSIEFILIHQLYISDRTGKVINDNFLKMPYPRRWKYDILSALDFFQYSNTKWDDRMYNAISELISKRNKNGSWNTQAAHPGKVHIVFEKAGKPGRMNTLRALRILRQYEMNELNGINEINKLEM